jgi:hypothetical protein
MGGMPKPQPGLTPAKGSVCRGNPYSIWVSEKQSLSES